MPSTFFLDSNISIALKYHIIPLDKEHNINVKL